MAHQSVNIVGNAKVRNNGPFSKSNNIASRVGELEANGERTIIDTDKSYRLDYLEWSCNHEEDVRIEIRAKEKDNPDGTLITRIIDKRGTILRSANALNIVEHASSIWDILDYDRNANAFKFGLKLSDLEFPEGLIIKIINSGDSARNAAVYFVGREL